MPPPGQAGLTSGRGSPGGNPKGFPSPCSFTFLPEWLLLWGGAVLCAPLTSPPPLSGDPADCRSLPPGGCTTLAQARGVAFWRPVVEAPSASGSSLGSGKKIGSGSQQAWEGHSPSRLGYRWGSRPPPCAHPFPANSSQALLFSVQSSASGAPHS